MPELTDLCGFAKVSGLPSHGGDDCASREFTLSDVGITMRFVIVNLFDRVYEIRNGTGIGVGAPQYRLRCGCSSASQSHSDVLP
ncbi:MAG: hypothetical protein ACRESA_00280 [Gammaproteobacteria bacterium]